jgi:hypothetical protein
MLILKPTASVYKSDVGCNHHHDGDEDNHAITRRADDADDDADEDDEDDGDGDDDDDGDDLSNIHI